MLSRCVHLFAIAAILSYVPGAGAAGAGEDERSTAQHRVETVLSYSAPDVASPAQPEATGETEDCRGCHSDSLTVSNRTYHASLEESCFACHQGQAARAHMEGQLEGNDVPGPSIETLDTEQANSICLSCHETSHHPGWEGSTHQRRGLECISCHSVHSFQSEQDQLKTIEASATCYACHQNVRAQMLRTSHHPVREGVMGCESCHNPHDGSTPKMIRADWANELCLQCHQEKRGPFLWEHAPVRENCLNCHNPHGSNHDKMLVAKLPYLCQRCHLNTRHPGTFYDGSNAGTPIAAASNRLIEHACKNCHQNIHGSNAPSGPYLGR